MNHRPSQLHRKLLMTRSRVLAFCLASVLSLGMLTVFTASAQAAVPAYCVAVSVWKDNPEYGTYQNVTARNDCGRDVHVVIKFAYDFDIDCFLLRAGHTYRDAKSTFAKFTGVDHC